MLPDRQATRQQRTLCSLSTKVSTVVLTVIRHLPIPVTSCGRGLDVGAHSVTSKSSDIDQAGGGVKADESGEIDHSQTRERLAA
jgi:hypothetical protein